MSLRLTHRRDFYAGVLLVLIGLGAALKGPDYGIGTLMHMGPGFMPTALGVILVGLGVVVAGMALAATDGEVQHILPEQRQWRGWLCILAGPVLFIVCGVYAGLLPATFACVFVSALGDRTATWRGALVLAAVVSVLGVAIFSYFLQVPLPVLRWAAS